MSRLCVCAASVDNLAPWPARVDPAREHPRDLQTRIAIENKLRDDLLHPGRADFCIGRDDVIVPKGKVVPDCRIEMMIMKFSGFDRT